MGPAVVGKALVRYRLRVNHEVSVRAYAVKYEFAPEGLHRGVSYGLPQLLVLVGYLFCQQASGNVRYGESGVVFREAYRYAYDRVEFLAQRVRLYRVVVEVNLVLVFPVGIIPIICSGDVAEVSLIKLGVYAAVVVVVKT